MFNGFNKNFVGKFIEINDFTEKMLEKRKLSQRYMKKDTDKSIYLLFNCSQKSF